MTSQADVTPLLKDSRQAQVETVDDEQSPTACGSISRVAVANAVTYAINFGFVALSNFGTFGKDNATVSNAYPTLATPAGYAFSIWGLIFLLETVLVVYQLLPRNSASPAITHGLGPWFALANVLQAAWSVAFAQEAIAVSAAIILAEAACLAAASAGLAPYRNGEVATAGVGAMAALHAPIGLHAGWVVAAALVNVNLALVAASAALSTQVTAATVTIFAAAAAGAVYGVRLSDAAFVASVAWALFAVAKNEDYRTSVLGPEIGAGFAGAITVVASSLLALEAAALLRGAARR